MSCKIATSPIDVDMILQIQNPQATDTRVLLERGPGRGDCNYSYNKEESST